MIIENINIYDLIPVQITDMINKLNNALEIIKTICPKKCVQKLDRDPIILN